MSKMLNVPEVAVQVLPGLGRQEIVTADPKGLQLRLVLWLPLGPHSVNCTSPVGIGAVGKTSGEMSTVAVSVTESPAVSVPVSLDRVSVVDGCSTKKHSSVRESCEEWV